MGVGVGVDVGGGGGGGTVGGGGGGGQYGSQPPGFGSPQQPETSQLEQIPLSHPQLGTHVLFPFSSKGQSQHEPRHTWHLLASWGQPAKTGETTGVEKKTAAATAMIITPAILIQRIILPLA